MEQMIPQPPGLIHTTAPPYVSVILNWGFLGILSTQVYIYYEAFPSDRVFLKILIFVTYLIEIAQTIIITQTGWVWYVTGYGDFRQFDVIGTSWISVTLFGGIVAFMVHSFYAYRIRILSQSRIVPGIIMLLAIVSLGGSIAISINSALVRLFHLLTVNKLFFFPILGLWQGTASGCDILIACCMIYQLRRFSKEGQPVVKRHLTGIIQLTVETGALTATISVVSLVLAYSVSNHLPYWQVPISCVAKLYSNTMLAVVNSRVEFKVASNSTTWNELHFSNNQRDIEHNASTTRLTDMSMAFAVGENSHVSGQESSISNI